MTKYKYHIKLVFTTLLLITVTTVIFAQNNEKVFQEGRVSYISGKNIYVKYVNTNGIENGDTLYLNQNNTYIPALIVQHHSSISCLCSSIADIDFKQGNEIYAKLQVIPINENIQPVRETHEIERDINEQVLIRQKSKKATSASTNGVSGRISASSYSTISNSLAENSHRFRYTLSLEALNISESSLSAETYFSFAHKLHKWDEVKNNLNSALRVYNFAFKYNFNDHSEIWVGRKINPSIANLGAIDGIQFQNTWNKYYAGIVAGSRPDHLDYGYNSKLLEYGAYFGHKINTSGGYVNSSLAFFEQRNTGKTDRRFVYFQHTNSLLNDLSLFSSLELDLYKVENGISKNDLNLTSLYLSLRYRITRQLSLNGSYDNRRNVIYYETFKNYAEEILQQASRQGVRFRVNYRPVNLINLGATAGTRYRKGDARRTNTLNTYGTYTNIPGLNASLTLSGNIMQTSYLDGTIYGIRLSKDFAEGKLNTVVYYRLVNFNYVNFNSSLKQNIGQIDFSYYFNKKLFLSVNLEATVQKKNKFGRIYINIRQRF